MPMSKIPHSGSKVRLPDGREGSVAYVINGTATVNITSDPRRAYAECVSAAQLTVLEGLEVSI